MTQSSVSNFRMMRLLTFAFTFAVLGIGHAALADDGNAELEHSLTAIMHDKYESIDKRIAACKGLEMPDCSEAGINRSTQGAAANDPSMQLNCDAVAKVANLSCMTPGTEGMEPGEAAVYTMMMNQLITTGSQIASLGKEMSAQCKAQADISKIMGTINGVKGGACMASVKACTSTCGDEAEVHAALGKKYDAGSNATQAEAEKTLAFKARKNKTICSAYTSQSAAMMMGAMQNMANFAVNRQCEKDFAATSATLPPIPTLSPIAGVGDCSDPNNQTLACFCAKAENKSTAMCAGFGNGSLASNGTTTVPNGSTVASPISGSLADGTDGNTIDPFALPKKDGNGDQKGQGDGGSGAPGGGGLSSLASEGGAGGAAADPRSAITGTSGGNASGLGSAGGGSGSGGLARNNGAAKEGFFDKFNLKKFLPGSKYKTRGIAGMSVKSVDGITGPMGPTLFEKATRQYQEQIQKQNVILDK